MITNLTELNHTITSIIDRAQEFAAASEKNSHAPFDYYAVSDLINREDWQKYFGFIRHELENNKSLPMGIQADHNSFRFLPDTDQSAYRIPCLASTPVTQTSYEDLIIQSEMQKEQCMLSGIGSLRDNPFRVCVNVYGQMDEDLLSQFPGAKDMFEKHFEKSSPTSTYRYGAMISGKPALILNHELDLPFQQAGMEDPAFKHAVTAMMAGQLNALFSETNVHITYGRGSGNDGKDEIMAILPADASPELVRQFDQEFNRALQSLPLSKDLNWAKGQYQALFFQMQNALENSDNIASWTKANPEEAICKAFETMGKQMGRRQREWSSSSSNEDLSTRLSNQFDIRRAAQDRSYGLLCSSLVSAGIRAAERDLAQSIRLYTSDSPDKAESFTVSKGQLSQTLKEMGYQQENASFFFMLGYPAEVAREVKNLVSQMPKLSLAEKIQAAERRKSNDHSKKPLQRDHGRGIDL